MSQTQSGHSTLAVFGVLLFNFACYFNIGVPLAVLPAHVAHDMGLGSVMAGVVIGAQSLATLLSRTLAGHLCDSRGSKYSVVWGLVALTGSGIAMSIATHASSTATIIAWLLTGRAMLGVAESLVTTGTMTWAIRMVEPSRAATAISWNGVTSYGGIALGAPAGAAACAYWGVDALGWLAWLPGLICLMLVRGKPAVAPLGGHGVPLSQVLLRVLPLGCGLALATMGFGAVASFISLRYLAAHWPHAALALSVFGGCFVFVRVILASTISRFGGFHVARYALPVEALGLACVGFAPSPAVALIGVAVAGAGFSLIFPALAIEVTKRLPESNRGTALGVFGLFFDLALGITGPVGGLLASQAGYPLVYYVVAASALVATALVVALGRSASDTTAPTPSRRA
ncbi:MAG: MFS transporter [Burkholderiales bacterium]|nr:MFS transporter [Burkholderiales bacterium]